MSNSNDDLPDDLLNNFYTDRRPNNLFSRLTKREYFAAMALQGILTSMSDKISLEGLDTSYHRGPISACAVRFAESLIEELER